MSLRLDGCRTLSYHRSVATIATLLIFGALLLLLETVLPGLIAGIIGVCCIGAAVALAYMRFDFQTGHTVLAIAVGGLIIGTVLYLRYFPESRVTQVFVSKRTVGEIGTEDPSLVNQTGETLTALRPSGKALIQGKRCDVVSEGAFIDAGKIVKVIAVEGLRVVVRSVER
jgi:membrane-bound serine protease (ClpP class)